MILKKKKKIPKMHEVLILTYYRPSDRQFADTSAALFIVQLANDF